MTEGGADADVLSDGRPESNRPPRTFRRTTGASATPHWATRWSTHWDGLSRARRRWVAGIAGVALVGAALGVQSYVQRSPALPALTFELKSLDYSEVSMHLEDPSVAADATVVQLGLTVAASTDSTRATISALTGLGIRTAPAVPHLVSGPVAHSTTVNAVVDCTALRLPVRADDVRAHVDVSVAGRTASGDVLLGAAGRVWANQVNRLCSAHLAARNLTVTQVTGGVDPAKTAVDLALVVRNQGPESGWLRLSGGTTAGAGDATVSATPVNAAVPAGGSVTMLTRIDLLRCPSWDQTRTASDTTQTPLNLLATVSPDVAAGDVVRGDRSEPWSFGPLPLEPTAADALKALLVQACGGIASPVLLSQQPHASFDQRTRILTTRLDAYLPTGVVQRVRFLPSQSTTYPPLEPVLDTAWVVPDAAGVASTRVQFRVPLGTPCFGGGPALTVDVETESVPTGPGEQPRRAIFTMFSETFLVPADFAVACQS